jgi:hypothetical protein
MADAAPQHGDPAPSAEMLDFSAFLARFFPGRRRHDFAAITAYAAYRREGGPSNGNRDR